MPRIFLPLVLAVVLTPGVGAQIKITNPGFGPKETLSYAETVGSASHLYDVTLTQVGEGAASRLEFRSVGADLESVYRLDPVTLVSLSSETITRAADATVRKTAEYQNLRPKAGPDDLVVTDLGSLPVVLRGLPWGRVTSAKILYVGNTSYGGTAISFEIQVVGRETITAAGRTWDCWHLTTGLGGALSLMMAKTDLWFAVEGTHPLVKTSGPVGGPGSPTRTLLLQTYTVGK